MGQYYKPVSVPKKEHVYSHTYGNGLKLMEHSYVGNNFVEAVKTLLIPGGRWYKDSFVWGGDYADCEIHKDCDKKGEGHENLYDLAEDNEVKPQEEFDAERFHFLVNHTKKQYIDYNQLLVEPETEKEEHPFNENDCDDKYIIDPLPLLTCEGNGRGGGDYNGSDPRVGEWARDSISIEETAPEDYELVDGHFVEV